MCGRFNLDNPAALVERFSVTRDAELFDGLKPRYNISPSQTLAAIRSDHGERTACLLRWGLIPAWSKEPKTSYSTINARAETVAEKPAYRSAFKSRRCLIPATGFYEWKQDGRKQPFSIRLPDGEPFAMAGLWERWQGEDQALESCTIIVTEGNQEMKAIHDRMPVILKPENFDLWLDPEVNDRRLLLPLLRPWPGVLNILPASRRVNSPRNDDPSVLIPD